MTANNKRNLIVQVCAHTADKYNEGVEFFNTETKKKVKQ